MRTARPSKVDPGDTAHDALVAELAALLHPAEEAAAALDTARSGPVALLVGAPRCGATLLLQLLAASGAVAYPTNLLARFAKAPAIGARIQRLLLDSDHARDGELSDLAPAAVGFESDHGRTRGTLAPNEFSEFWQRFVPTQEVEPLGPRAREVDTAGLRRAFTALTTVFAAPFALKASPLMFDLGFAAEALPEAVFVHVVRDGVANARSLLEARKRHKGSHERWYGARPPEYWDLVAEPPAAQCAGQVFYTNRHVAAALGALPAGRAVTISYQALCADPLAYIERVTGALVAHAERLGSPCRPRSVAGNFAAPALEARDRARGKGAEFEAVPAAWQRLSVANAR